ncbi:MAG: hypothetical protein MI673_00545 [Thiotrichales bacterium]|nr:hypothetical protein [Thiotrichales bacterium]
MQEQITPEEALDLLKEGNQRFVTDQGVNRNLLQQAKETSGAQYPFAIILSCIDSRTSAEIIFDQGLGDIFSARIAGNIINEDILGSMEFACHVAGTKIIVVLGHSACGAVKGACDAVEMGNLTTLLSKISPVVDSEITVTKDRTSENPEFVEKVTIANIKHVMQEIQERSPIIKDLLDANRIKLVGGYHDLTTGTVTFEI